MSDLPQGAGKKPKFLNRTLNPKEPKNSENGTLHSKENLTLSKQNPNTLKQNPTLLNRTLHS